MRRTALPLSKRAPTLAVFVAVTLVVAGGAALAVSKVGTNGPDILRGTNKSDFLSGRGGGDDIYGLGGTDDLQGGPGKDFLFGGRCEDFRSDGSCADFRFSSGNKGPRAQHQPYHQRKESVPQGVRAHRAFGYCRLLPHDGR